MQLSLPNVCDFYIGNDFKLTNIFIVRGASNTRCTLRILSLIGLLTPIGLRRSQSQGIDSSDGKFDHTQERSSMVENSVKDRRQEHGSMVKCSVIDRRQEHSSMVELSVIDRIQEHSSMVEIKLTDRKEEHSSMVEIKITDNRQEYTSMGKIKTLSSIQERHIRSNSGSLDCENWDPCEFIVFVSNRWVSVDVLLGWIRQWLCIFTNVITYFQLQPNTPRSVVYQLSCLIVSMMYGFFRAVNSTKGFILWLLIFSLPIRSLCNPQNLSNLCVPGLIDYDTSQVVGRSTSSAIEASRYMQSDISIHVSKPLVCISSDGNQTTYIHNNASNESLDFDYVPYSYDWRVVHLGPMTARIHIDILHAVTFSKRHLMTKSDFSGVMDALMRVKGMSMNDLFAIHLFRKTKRLSNLSGANQMDYSPMGLVGGGKVTHDRKQTVKIEKGSKIFHGDFIVEYPCFSVKDGTLLPIVDLRHIQSNSYELLNVDEVGHLSNMVGSIDVVCNMPSKTLLSKLNKTMLKTVNILVDGEDTHNQSRSGLIISIECALARRNHHELTAYFVERKKSGRVFPKRNENMKLHQKNILVPDSFSPEPQSPSPSMDIDEPSGCTFPPEPLSDLQKHSLITNYCEEFDPSRLNESGCAVCGHLTIVNDSVPIQDLDLEYLRPFTRKVTRRERQNANEPVRPVDGLPLDLKCNLVCNECAVDVRKRKLPKMSLANGNWLGEVPSVLKELTFAERLLIAKIRTNRFAVKVDSGLYKTKCNIIAFDSPVPQIYEALPPPLADIQEVFAVLFVRSTPPSEKEKNEPPLYNVRREKVREALDWLKLNHIEYENVFVSHENLKQYPENGSPVTVVMLKAEDLDTNKQPESTAVNDTELEEGVEEGPIEPTVHGLTDKDAPIKAWNKLASDALSNLANGEQMMVVGHTDATQSLFKNPSLYSSAFPWLFPYGLGGIDNTNKQIKTSTLLHKRHLLMYHDKRFQLDSLFSIFAFNHEQIKDSTTAGFIQTKHSNFQEVCDRISNLDHGVLQDINERFAKGEKVTAVTEAEKQCFKLINDLDNVSEKVQGSLTSKKRMRNEIWSLVNFKGAPSWFVTFAPADNHHPLSLYFADTDEKFVPRFRTSSERYRLIARNPVAGARFFDFMVKVFIKHVLGVDCESGGVFGKPAAYYGTVEQQGRLTLHLHLLLWIQNSLSPQEIRNRIMDPSSDFQKRMIDYLEAAHQGEYKESTESLVREDLNDRESQNGYVRPSELLPNPPPPFCDCEKEGCVPCIEYRDWKIEYKETLNDILFRTNRHTCSKNNCMANRYNTCKARFPRQVFRSSMVDPLTGALCMKQLEPMLNTFNEIMPFLQRCNSDATSLLSGTAIKSTISYVTDYITKCSLNTHVIFQSVASIFEKFPHLKGTAEDSLHKTRQLLTKLCNSLISKLEIGAPMASMYLLGNPDHYTSHSFVNIYWRSFVNECIRSTTNDERIKKLVPDLTVTITKDMRASSPVYDYMYRPLKFSEMSLYDWVQQFQKVKGGTHHSETANHRREEDYEECEYEDNNHEVPISRGKRKRDDSSDMDMQPTKYDSDMFLEGHPQRQTHRPKMLSEVDYRNRVPNFVGGILPRKDNGDFEFYATTMLTLFKPWRSGTDLKSNDVSWAEQFNAHSFSSKEIKLMSNFNLRYECSDARDDYSSQRKSNDISGNQSFGIPLDIDACDDLDAQCEVDGALNRSMDDGWITSDDEDTEDPFSVPGAKAQNQILKMNAIEMLLHQIGWTKKKDEFAPTTMTERLDIDKTIDWSVVLKEKRAEVLASRADISEQSGPDVVEETKKSISEESMKYIKAYLNKTENLVRWKDITYLFKNYKEEQKQLSDLRNTISASFKLNAEQQRAFNIITNHVTSHTSHRLQMYLGGMAGTGKSQVIKAVTQFFEDIGQSGQMVLLAPTGSAAALIGGSTYHSYLGLRDRDQRCSQASLAKLKQKTANVRYIFIDEVSMLSCMDLYKISAQLAMLRPENQEDPFGGINMIFAGDFAQLPPVGASASLYSHIVRSNSTTGQKVAIGKALWHQTTTVVILRENMRQRSQTKNDARLRTALENMRYKACTVDDIEYLHEISRCSAVKEKMKDERFRNVSVITAQNIHRDRINELGSARFAADHNLNLISFYSKDAWPGGPRISSNKKRKTSNGSTKLTDANTMTKIAPSLQKTLWNLTPKVTEHKSGTLKLCKGLPVLIKFNEATECCVTNGAEAHVVDWISYLNPDNNARTLKTLFVKLHNPPTLIKLPGLPLNVVPISPESRTIDCEVPDGSMIKISRSQIPVIPNFAMTDYCSQGRTRPFNVVHLNNCKSHQSYYTCLSRSATHEGTFILNGFNSSKITSSSEALPGNIRQEFRELEILDEISKLNYEGLLPSHVNGIVRRDLITQYRKWIGDDHNPKPMHDALKWTKKSPFTLSSCEDIQWRIVKGQRQITKVKNATPVGHKDVSMFVPVQSKIAPRASPNSLPTSIPNAEHQQQPYPSNERSGLQWDSRNYSCGYDSLFTILWNLWNEEKHVVVDQNVPLNNVYFQSLMNGFEQHNNNQISLETARNNVRDLLQRDHIDKFPTGRAGLDVKDLLQCMFAHDEQRPLGHETTLCDACGLHDPTSMPTTSSVFQFSADTWRLSTMHEHPQYPAHGNTGHCAEMYLKSLRIRTPCPECRSNLIVQKQFDVLPNLLIIQLGTQSMNLSHTLETDTMHGPHNYRLTGLIYFGDFHFTSAYIDKNKRVWYHDGIDTGRSQKYQGTLNSLNNRNLVYSHGKQVCTVIYSKM